MRRATIPIIFVSVLALVLVTTTMIMKERTYVFESINDAQAMWNEEILFIVIEKSVAAQKTSRFLSKVSEWSRLVFPKPDFLPEDLIIFRIKEGEIDTKEEYKRVGLIGGIIPFGGQIYFSSGTLDPRDYPRLDRLENKRLIRVPREEAEAIVKSFELQSELIKREGWQRQNLYFTEGQRAYPVEQKGKKLTIVLSKSRHTRISRIELINEQTNEAQMIYELSGRLRGLDEEEARQLKAKPN